MGGKGGGGGVTECNMGGIGGGGCDGGGGGGVTECNMGGKGIGVVGNDFVYRMRHVIILFC